jgi:endoribonuclease Dicer
VELLEDALCENTIVNLGTGAGKTFIAVMLIKELSYQILDRPFTGKAKRTVFLVTTVPLVKQQAEYLRVYTMLDVGEYIGEMKVDDWSQERWWEELSKNHVLVMTPTIFKNILQGGFVHLRNVNLLVFDECHHAVKNHDYVQIMKMFNSCKSSMDYPHILGLSASLLPNKCKPGELKKQVKELETTLCCRCQTARDYEEVAMYATNPDEEAPVYLVSPLPHLQLHTAELRAILCEPLAFLNSLPKTQREDKCYQIAKVNLDDCMHILNNLGVWCALNCAEHCIAGLHSALSSEDGLLEPPQKALLGLSLTHLNMFAKKARDLHNPDDVDVTYKVQFLIECLKQQVNTSRATCQKKKGSKMLGIVFVERRMTAFLLTRLLNVLIACNPQLAPIKCDYIVGHNDTKGMTTLRKEAHMKVKKQHEILEKFRKGKITLLIATSVVEEGIDVPQCNLVIRFDFPPNIRSYIQSKGRARAKPSKYILMIEDAKEFKARSDLRGYRIVEEDMRELCQNRSPPDDEEFLKFLEEQECNIYAPYGIEAGVRATLSSSLSFLYKYCQKFSDRFTSFAPIFESEQPRQRALSPEPYSHILMSRSGLEFRSTVQLPISCPIREKITGHWIPERRRIADKSAALAAIRELHQRGELDEHLKPVTRDPDSDEDEEEGEGEEEKHAGTEKRAKYYPDEIASSFRDCFPKEGSGNYLYILLMEEFGSDIQKFPFSKQPPHGPHHGIGILTQTPLPHKQIPEFSLYEKRMEIGVKVVELSTRVTAVTTAEIDLLKQCHQTMFKSVLKIDSPLLECSFHELSTNILIVPINVWQMQNPPLAHIDFEMAERVVEAGHPNAHPLQWPFPVEDAVVTKNYQCEGHLLEVMAVNKEVTPSHQFPDPSFQSYADYFQKRYTVHIENNDQPGLECKKIGFSESRLRLITSRFRNTHGTELDQSTSKPEMLFAEVTCLYPLPASFVKVIRCLPSMLWRIESLLGVNDLRSTVTQSTGVGRMSTTCTHLRGYTDYGLGQLKTRWDLESDSVAVRAPIDEVIVRGPGNALLLQAATLRSANDSIDNERLETLGDSFLKLATSIFLYCDRPNAYEGRLTSARMRRIGNLNLFRLAKKRKLMGRIFSKKFTPTGGWMPPCHTFTEAGHKGEREESNGSCGGTKASELSDNERQYMYHRVTDKGAADFMESLIGAYLVAGGMEAAIRFMKWIGVKITRKREEHKDESQHMSEGELQSESSSESLDIPRSKRFRQSTDHDPILGTNDDANLLIDRSPEILQQHFGPVPPSLFDTTKQDVVFKLLRSSTGSIEPGQIQGIDYRFKDKALLLQALTHASYQRNRVTDCYQRLEFLGDAVLDYLITIQIYERFPHFDPGKITDMRSALVNNNLFAELAVKLQLHKVFLHNSPTLFRLIPEYESFITATRDPTQDEDNVEHLPEHSGDNDALPQGGGQEMDSDSEDEAEDEDVEPPKVLGDLLESLAGAIFMDSGMDLQAVWNTLGPLFTEKIEIFKDKIPIPPIKELYQLFPGVTVKCAPAGQGRTCCTIKHEEREVAKVLANSRKAAKNAAARAALRQLSSN